jgi:hypothetical protein
MNGRSYSQLEAAPVRDTIVKRFPSSLDVVAAPGDVSRS